MYINPLIIYLGSKTFWRFGKHLFKRYRTFLTKLLLNTTRCKQRATVNVQPVKLTLPICKNRTLRKKKKTQTANILTLGELCKDGKGLILRRGKVRWDLKVSLLNFWPVKYCLKYEWIVSFLKFMHRTGSQSPLYIIKIKHLYNAKTMHILKSAFIKLKTIN